MLEKLKKYRSVVSRVGHIVAKKPTEWKALYLEMLKANRFAKDLKLDKSGLTATDERDRRFLIDPKAPGGAIVAGLSAQLQNVTVAKDQSIALDFVLVNHSDEAIVLAERCDLLDNSAIHQAKVASVDRYFA